MDHLIVDVVLRIRHLCRRALVESLDVAFVVTVPTAVGRPDRGRQRAAICRATPLPRPRLRRRWRRRLSLGSPAAGFPGAAVAEPQCWQNVKFGGIRSGVTERDACAHVARRALGVLHRDPPVAISLEKSGVNQLEFALILVSPCVLLPKSCIGKTRPAVVVAPAQPGCHRCTTSTLWRPRRDFLAGR